MISAHAKTPSAAARILVVDDHARARQSMADVLTAAGYRIVAAASGQEAFAQLSSGNAFDVVVTDLQMPGMSGLEFTQRIQNRRLSTQIIIVTAHASIPTAVEAMRAGAFDYLEKPFSAERLEEIVAQAIALKTALASSDSGVATALAAAPPAAGPGAESAVQMIGSSAAIENLREQIERIATTNETVLITGESGTGKELVARCIHALSPRRNAAFVGLNCPALSAQLMESELFGHVRGAFTGAETDRVGRFEQAQGGTLLLDEVTEIGIDLQAKLLRVLQERSFEPVGSCKTLVADVRLLATSNRELVDEVANGRLREDLYYRLAVVPLVVPPLRDRGDDVLELAEFFLDRAATRLSQPRCELDAAAKRLFRDYYWPGNVRELENIVTRGCVMARTRTITANELQPWLAAGRPALAADTQRDRDSPLPRPGTSLEEMERQLIEATLNHFDGHRQKAAEALGIGVRTLSGKLRSYGYPPGTKDFTRRAA